MFLKFLDANWFEVGLFICAFVLLFISIGDFTMDMRLDRLPRYNGIIAEKGSDNEGIFVVVAYDVNYKGIEHSGTEKYYVSAAEYISLSVDDIISFGEKNELVIPWMEDPTK